MPRYIVDLSEDASRLIEAEIAEGRKPSAESFLEDLLREEQARRNALDALLDEGFEAGQPIPADEDFWAERRRKLSAAMLESTAIEK